jgi:hypothetical protein
MQTAIPSTSQFAILALSHEKALKTQHVVNQKFVASKFFMARTRVYLIVRKQKSKLTQVSI